MRRPRRPGAGGSVGSDASVGVPPWKVGSLASGEAFPSLFHPAPPPDTQAVHRNLCSFVILRFEACALDPRQRFSHTRSVAATACSECFLA